MTSPSPPIHEQLRAAWIASGLTLETLRERAGLEYGAHNLSRKLAGKQVLTTDEAERLADALTLTLLWAPGRRRRAA